MSASNKGNKNKSTQSSSARPSFSSSLAGSGVRVDLSNPDPAVVDVVSRHLVQPQDISQNGSSPSSGTPTSSSFQSRRINYGKTTGGSQNNSYNKLASNSILGSSMASNTDYSLQLKGGDITRDLYKWQAQHGGNTAGGINASATSPSAEGSGNDQRRRSMSFSGGAESLKMGAPVMFQTPESNTVLGPSTPNVNNTHLAGDGSMQNDNGENPLMSVNEMRAPNGFRRSFIMNKQLQHHRKHHSKKVYTPPNFLTRNFIEFLTIYGHFAGEDLSDDEDDDSDADSDEDDLEDGLDDNALEDEEDEDEEDLVDNDQYAASSDVTTETSSLLPKHTKKLNLSTELNTKINQKIKSRALQKQRRADKDSKKVSNTKATLLLIKAFVGTGVLFLPKSFENAGYMFAIICLAICSILSYYCFVILIVSRNSLNTKARLGYGELGYALFGKFFQTAILQSIILSQIGFASAYIVFTATNLQQFFQSFMSLTYPLSVFIFSQMIVFIPLSLTRNISKLSGTALVADAFIFIGLIYVFYYSSYHLVQQGGISKTIIPFNSETWSLFIGTAIFTFEGIGLLIPIQDSMKRPQDFSRLLAYVLSGATVLFIGCGLLCYLSYGKDVQTVILLNFPSDSIMTQTTQFLYAMAILLSTPLQFFPAIRILENQYIFPKKSGKHSVKVKWLKNNFRTAIVALGCFIAYVGANDLDKFVSLVGSLSCIPLIYIYPPLMHAKTHPKYAKLDWSICALGMSILVYTTYQTLSMWGK